MKTRLKKKMFVRKTRNKKIKLLSWERQLLQAIEGDSNPTIGRIEEPCRLVQIKKKRPKRKTTNCAAKRE